MISATIIFSPNMEKIKTEDFYKDISEDVEKGFDTSNFPKDHPSGIPVGKSVVKKDIFHEDYRYCLFSEKPQMRKMNVIRSHRHEIFSETVNKIALSANDDKRIIMEDKISTLSYGHYKI